MKNNKIVNFLYSKNGSIVLTIILYILSFLGISILGGLTDYIHINEGVLSVISIIVFILLGVCGWKTLTFITPNIFLIMPLVGWVAYFLIKGLLSVVAGIFVAPYYISKTILETLIIMCENEE